MHYVCYTCDTCDSGFAMQSFDAGDELSCPVCGFESVSETGEVIVNPNIMGKSRAHREGHIYDPWQEEEEA